MTLCIAWVRQLSDVEELIFATDSALTMGEKWNHGIKLFELPRPDCLICFAGDTGRAYPLILNLISSFKLSRELKNPHADITEVLDHLTTLFSALVSRIEDDGELGIVEELKASAEFLFGGWSWTENRFRIWKVFYSKEAGGFIFREFTTEKKSREIAFLGNPETVESIAQQNYQNAFSDEKFDNRLDMEPLRILIDLSLDNKPSSREVDGAIQIAKIYKSGTIEFFGIQWPSSNGNPHFQGREFGKHNKPEARYFNPDTLELIEDQLPLIIPDMSLFEHLEEYDLICECYDNDGGLKPNLTNTSRERLIHTFREVAYSAYIETISSER